MLRDERGDERTPRVDLPSLRPRRVESRAGNRAADTSMTQLLGHERVREGHPVARSHVIHDGQLTLHVRLESPRWLVVHHLDRHLLAHETPAFTSALAHSTIAATNPAIVDRFVSTTGSMPAARKASLVTGPIEADATRRAASIPTVSTYACTAAAEVNVAR